MANNFGKRKYAQVGEIIYPAYNGTNGFFQTPRWDLVIETDKDNKIIDVRCIWDQSTVKAIELVRDHFLDLPITKTFTE